MRVAGLVTLDGMPLGDANVQLMPEAGGQAIARGKTNEDGRYALQPGVPPGTYRARISAEQLPVAGNAVEMKIDVRDKAGDLDFDLASNVLKYRQQRQ